MIPEVHEMRDACAAGILIRSVEVLLVKRSASKTFYPDVWDLPGGHIEAGESPKTTLVRELEEELGIIVTDLEPLGTFEDVQKYGPYECHVFLVIAWRGNPFNRQPEEHSEIRWVTVEDTRHLELPHQRYPDLLQHALQRVGRSR